MFRLLKYLFFALSLFFFCGTADIAVAQTNNEVTTTDSCAPSKSWESWKKDCYFCDLFAVLFNACSNVAKKASKALSKSFASILIMSFGIWIAFTILSFVSSFETKDGRDLIVSIVNQTFIVLMAFYLLMGKGGANGFFDLVMSPIFNTGLHIAQGAISDTVAKNKTTINAKHYNATNPTATGMCTNNYNIKDGGLPKSMGQNIVCMIDLLQSRIARVTALGSSAMCYSWQERHFIIPKWSYLITGILLWLGSMLMMVGYPFLMIDTVIQLGVASALLPAAVFAFCFKITRKYCKKVWDAFLNAMFNFIFLSIIVLLLATAMESTITTNASNLDDLLNGKANNMANLLSQLHWSGVNSLKIVFVMLLTWAVLPEVNSFASDFAGSLGKGGIGSKVGGLLGSTAKQGIMSSTRSVRKGASTAVKNVGRNVLSATKGVTFGGIRMLTQSSKAKWYQRRAQNQTSKGKSGASIVRNADGSTTYTYQTRIGGLLRKKTKSVTIGADGQKTFRVEKQMFNGEKRVRVSSQNAVVRQRIDKAGNIYRDKMKGKGNIGRRMIDGTSGKLHQQNIETIINQLGGDDNAKAAVVRKMAHEQMKNLNPFWRKVKEHVFTRKVTDIIKDGKKIGYSVAETYANGSKRIYSITFADNGRAMTEAMHIDKAGRAMRMQTDGVMNKKTVGRLDASGNFDLRSARTTVDFTDEYRNRSETEINNAGSLFSERDLAKANVNRKLGKVGRDRIDLEMRGLS